MAIGMQWADADFTGVSETARYSMRDTLLSLALPVPAAGEMSTVRTTAIYRRVRAQLLPLQFLGAAR